MTSRGTADVVIVGAGIVGLALALAAHSRGLRVLVLERDDRAVGASVRNFGHVCATAQSGVAYDYAQRSREVWLKLHAAGVLPVEQTGTLVLARARDELDVLEEFAFRRPGACQLLSAAEIRAEVDVSVDVLGGARLPDDLRVDPRTSVHRIADFLASAGVEFHYSTNVLGVGGGSVLTSRGAFTAQATILAVGHDLDRLFPDITSRLQVTRCVLRMLNVSNPVQRPFRPAVFSGFSIARYAGFAECASTTTVRARLRREYPRLMDAGLNLMFTQRPDGSLIVGDTHHYADTHEPFDDEGLRSLVLGEVSSLLGVPDLQVRQSWRGVYASAPAPYLVETVEPGLAAVAVTSGIGMTTSFGLAEEALEKVLAA